MVPIVPTSTRTPSDLRKESSILAFVLGGLSIDVIYLIGEILQGVGDFLRYFIC